MSPPSRFGVPTEMRAFAKISSEALGVEMRSVPVPEVGPGELLVRVCAVGVGVHDAYFLPPRMSFPFPIGIEAAGEVVRTGEHVAGFGVGDRVAFVSAMQPKGSTWAEYAVVSADGLVVRIPDRMPYVDAAALPVAGNTALRVLHALALDSGESLFIAGASGAVGTVALQLARQRGMTVGGSASARNHQYLHELGSDLAVDYRDPGWPAAVRRWRPNGVDAAIAILPGTTADAMAVVRDGGRVISVSADQLETERGITLAELPYDLDVRRQLDRVFRDVATGTLRVVLDRVLPFDQSLAALRQAQSHHARGKIVLDVANEPAAQRA